MLRLLLKAAVGGENGDLRRTEAGSAGSLLGGLCVQLMDVSVKALSFGKRC